MTEIEQLRKELNELRERVARLERGKNAFYQQPPQPIWVSSPINK